ncbi:TPA: hypothetical protein ACSP1H_002400 [Aeromonas veronii]|uniref:hypothetical protein n=1 Tax=Aeromonas TaxID=642 RepID=UPI000ABFA1B9|nr:hypothetical protein [Aeromonas veronii]MBL0629292.1 hypothetical protein [Aeromonas veronii]
MKKTFLLFVCFMGTAHADPQLDLAAKQLGFTDWKHYQSNKTHCLNLYSKEVTSKMNMNCDLNMQCLQNDADLMSQRSTKLMNSKTWKDYGCDIIMQVEAGSSGSSSGEYYEIEVAHNDELFIINGEKFEAKTYCLGWDEGDRVKFLDGSPNGICTSAELLNLERDETCDVWCE